MVKHCLTATSGTIEMDGAIIDDAKRRAGLFFQRYLLTYSFGSLSLDFHVTEPSSTLGFSIPLAGSCKCG